MSMFGYVINPFDQTITKVPYKGDYKEIYTWIQADMFDCCRFSYKNADGCFVDDEGLISGKEQAFFMIGEYPSPLAGYGFVLGGDSEGESCSPKTALEDLNIRWVSLGDIRKMVASGDFN